MIIIELISPGCCRRSLNELMQITFLARARLTAIAVCTTLCYRVGTGGSRTNEKSPGHVAEKNPKYQVVKLAHEYSIFCGKVFLFLHLYVYLCTKRFLEGGLSKCRNGNVWAVKFFFLLYGWKGGKSIIIILEQENKNPLLSNVTVHIKNY